MHSIYKGLQNLYLSKPGTEIVNTRNRQHGTTYISPLKKHETQFLCIGKREEETQNVERTHKLISTQKIDNKSRIYLGLTINFSNSVIKGWGFSQ